MFIVWGKKHVTRRLGYVADFCPICRDLRLFKLKRLGLAGHIYYISLGEGDLIGHIQTCAVCDIDLNATPEDYKSVHPQKLPADQLAALTFPNWKERYAGRLQIERDLKTSPAKLSAENRRALIREPFVLLANKVEERFGATRLDWPTMGALAVLFVLLGVAASLAPKVPSAEDFIWAVAWLAGLGAVGYQLFRISGRYFESKIFPVLVPTLRTLNPTPQEIEAVLKELKQKGHKIGSKLKLKALLAAMQDSGEAPETVMASR